MDVYSELLLDIRENFEDFERLKIDLVGMQCHNLVRDRNCDKLKQYIGKELYR